MSGHSHWATTKRQKAGKDAARGKLFSKITRSISIAAKAGADPGSNSKLRFAIEQARSVNMPKENIQRAIERGTKNDVKMEEVVYEGFGPGGIGIIVEAATDNRNRTGAQIKYIFEKSGGNLSGPGSVSFNFDQVGLVVVEKAKNFDDQILKLIDMGVSDVNEEEGGVHTYTNPSDLAKVKSSIEEAGYKVKSFDLVRKPRSFLILEDRETAKKATELLESLEDDVDVTRLFTNAEIASDLIN